MLEVWIVVMVVVKTGTIVVTVRFTKIIFLKEITLRYVMPGDISRYVMQGQSDLHLTD